MSAGEVQERIPDLEQVSVYEIFDFHVAELTEVGFEQLTVLCEPLDHNCCGQATSVLKKSILMADNSANHLPHLLKCKMTVI